MRGKHKQSATIRRESESQRQVIERLRREVACAEQERDESRQKADYWKQRHARDVRNLRDELEAGTSDALRDAYAALDRARDKYAELERDKAHTVHVREKETEWFVRRCKADLRITGTEALELLLQIIAGTDDASRILGDSVPPGSPVRGNAEAVTRIARARGERVSEKVKLSRVRFAWGD